MASPLSYVETIQGTSRGGQPHQIYAKLRVRLPACTRYNLPVNPDDTIVAIATPPGRGGIGVVRLAGPEARRIAAPMLCLKHELEPGRAVFGELVEPCEPGGRGRLAREGTASSPEVLSPEGVSRPHDHEQRIDEVVVTYFARPHSYTTDEIVEIAAHGSPVELRNIGERWTTGVARLPGS